MHFDKSQNEVTYVLTYISYQINIISGNKDEHSVNNRNNDTSKTKTLSQIAMTQGSMKVRLGGVANTEDCP